MIATTNSRSISNLLFKITKKLTHFWRYFYCFYRDDRFVTSQVLFHFLLEKPEKNKYYYPNQFQDNDHLILTEVNKDYQKRISTYYYELSVVQKTFENLTIYQGSPLVDSQTFSDVIYMPQYRAFYLEDGSLIDYSCRPEYTIAPKKINIPQSLTRVDIPLIYGGHLNRHYGHFLTESICRLWYLSKDTERQVIYSESYRSSIEKTFIDVFMSSVFNKKRFISFSNPILLKEVTIPYPSFLFRKQAFSVHKCLPEFVADKILPIRLSQVEQPLYFSRKKINSKKNIRNIINEDLLEEKLREKNFAIAYPEELTLEEQIILVNRHKVLVGLWGSALHNILFNLSSNPNLVYLGDEEEINGNFVLVDGIKNVNSSYIAVLKLQKNSFKKKNRKRTIPRELNVENTLSTLKELGLF